MDWGNGNGGGGYDVFILNMYEGQGCKGKAKKRVLRHGWDAGFCWDHTTDGDSQGIGSVKAVNLWSDE